MCVGPFRPSEPDPVVLAPPPPAPSAMPTTQPTRSDQAERTAARRRTRQQAAFAVNRRDRLSAGAGGLGGVANTAGARLLGETTAVS